MRIFSYLNLFLIAIIHMYVANVSDFGDENSESTRFVGVK